MTRETFPTFVDSDKKKRNLSSPYFLHTTAMLELKLWHTLNFPRISAAAAMQSSFTDSSKIYFLHMYYAAVTLEEKKMSFLFVYKMDPFKYARKYIVRKKSKAV